MKKTSSIFLLLALALCWSCFAIFTKLGAASASFLLVGFARCFFGGLPLYLLCLVKKKNFLVRKNFKHYAVIGTFNSALPFCLYGLASKSLESGVLTILDGAILVFEVLITMVILKRNVAKSAILGTSLGIAGIILTSLSAASFKLELNYLFTIAIVLVATCCYAACSIYISNKCREIDPIILATGSIFYASLLLTPVLFFSELVVLRDVTTLVSLACLGIFCTGIAYIFYFKLLNEEGSRVAVSTSFLVPVLGMVWGIVFLGEEISATRVFGCLMIIIGMKFILNLSVKNFYKKGDSKFTIIQQ